jgi:hypothetical protein
MYTTTFSKTENPISEDGTWINGKAAGLDWANCATTNGYVYGLQSGPKGYDDATALLTGPWGSNQTVTATVHATKRLTGAVYEEVEVRLRSSISPRVNTGYEVNFSLRTGKDAYVEIVRWNGPVGKFSYVAQTNGAHLVLRDGDVVKGSISNSTIRAYINGRLVLQGNDRTYPTGNPGIGFYLQGTTGVNLEYGFKSVTVSDGAD